VSQGTFRDEGRFGHSCSRSLCESGLPGGGAPWNQPDAIAIFRAERTGARELQMARIRRTA
jgi:hypothetical protein